MRHYKFFATCGPGLEALLFRECKNLRFPKVECQVGGVYFEGSMEQAWRANLELRTAIRILRRISRFEAKDADSLYQEVRRISWERFIDPQGSFFVDTQTKDSSLSHSWR